VSQLKDKVVLHQFPFREIPRRAVSTPSSEGDPDLGLLRLLSKSESTLGRGSPHSFSVCER